MWEILRVELTTGLPDAAQLMHLLVRLVAAAVFGAALGIQREATGKPAGLRTHMLVALGTALFVLGAAAGGMDSSGVSRTIQGIAAGIGFIGAGSILKIEREHDIQGLTTAASLWMTAAIGVTVGLGALGLGAIATVLALIILALATLHERREHRTRGAEAADRQG